MHGSGELRETSAKSLGDLIRFTTTAALRPFLIKITGPLIRIVGECIDRLKQHCFVNRLKHTNTKTPPRPLGDRFPWQVKAAILETLCLLLEKGGPMLRPFLPQLQTTFVKSLHDPNDRVRHQRIYR